MDLAMTNSVLLFQARNDCAYVTASLKLVLPRDMREVR